MYLGCSVLHRRQRKWAGKPDVSLWVIPEYLGFGVLEMVQNHDLFRSFLFYLCGPGLCEFFLVRLTELLL